MSKGDYVIVKTEIGGKLETDEIRVNGAGGEVETSWTNQRLVVKVLGRTGKTRSQYTYTLSAVRSVQEVRRDEL
jgi:hypothetical protein